MKESSASVRLKMTSEGRVRLGLADVKRYGIPYFGRSDAERARTKMKGYVAEQKVKVKLLCPRQLMQEFCYEGYIKSLTL